MTVVPALAEAVAPDPRERAAQASSDRLSQPVPPRVLARIDGGPDRFVAWTAPQIAGDGLGLIIQAPVSEPPMVDGDFADDHSAIEVYVA